MDVSCLAGECRWETEQVSRWPPPRAAPQTAEVSRARAKCAVQAVQVSWAEKGGADIMVESSQVAADSYCSASI